MSASSASIEAWLRDHLPAIFGRTDLGIFCAGQGVRLDRVAPPLLPLPETVDRLAAHLGACGLLRPFATALLDEEAVHSTGHAEGLLALLGADRPAPRAREPKLAQRLSRAAYFTGRQEELARLDWAWQEGARVVALTGPPGSGRSSLLQHWLDGRGLSDPKRWQDFGVEGLFLWSFAANPSVAAFLRAAADHVEGRTGLHPVPPSEEAACRRDLSRLLVSLDRIKGHILLVLDGLERFQARPDRAPPGVFDAAERQLLMDSSLLPREGEIVDPWLRSLLIEMAAVDGEAALLCTLEREVPSLWPWRNSGYVAVPVSPLPPSDGVGMLRRCGVTRGALSDAERRCAEHGGHALTLDLIGRYLTHYYQGDARAVTLSELPPSDAGRLPEAPTLRRVLKAHLSALTEPLRGLLELCAVLPGPVSVSSLMALSQAAVEHGGQLLQVETVLAPLRGLTIEQIKDRLEELGRLGLINLDKAQEPPAIDVHPLLRRIVYRTWLDARGGRPVVSTSEEADYLPGPQDAAVIELLEQLVLAALQAGLLAEAYEILAVRMGGYPHLGRCLGEYRRLLAVLRILSPVMRTMARSDLSFRSRAARVVAWEATTLRNLGQLEHSLETVGQGIDGPAGAGVLLDAGIWEVQTLIARGQLQKAAQVAADACRSAASLAARVSAAHLRARTLLLLGEVSLSKIYLMEAELLLREASETTRTWDGLSLREGVAHTQVELLLRLCATTQAKQLLQRSYAAALRDGRGKDVAHLDILMGEIARRERDHLDASKFIHRALSWGSRTSDAEVLVAGGLCHARVRMDDGNLDGAASAVGVALSTATEHGFGLERIDLLILRGYLMLRRGDMTAAEADARDALAYATAQGCAYLWGEADALHLLAMVLLATRPATGARVLEAAAHLKDEIDLRERMLDPSARDVRWLLARLTD